MSQTEVHGCDQRDEQQKHRPLYAGVWVHAQTRRKSGEYRLSQEQELSGFQLVGEGGAIYSASSEDEAGAGEAAQT